LEPLNTGELVSVDSGKIVSVSVYAGRAEIVLMRAYTLTRSVKIGQNMVHIKGLRVEDSIQRNSVAITSIRSYIQNMKTEHVDPAELPRILDPFNRASEELDLKAMQPKKRQEELRSLKSEESRRCTVEEG
jgi:hypothetical protein